MLASEICRVRSSGLGWYLDIKTSAEILINQEKKMNFNGAQLHLLTNHLPVVGSLFATLVLLSGLLFKNSSVRRTGLALLAFAALTTLPAYYSGEPAEEKIEDLPGVSE
jgi:hypothetical protein